LQKAFPSEDRIELHDALKSSDWNVRDARIAIERTRAKQIQVKVKGQIIALTKERDDLAKEVEKLKASDQEKEAGIAQLNAKNDQFSHELTNAKATIVFEDKETKECVVFPNLSLLYPLSMTHMLYRTDTQIHYTQFLLYIRLARIILNHSNIHHC
jgi:hypothetical protein